MSLKIRRLTCYASSRKILDGVDLEVFEGKIHILVGPNGSGKSTLAETIMGNPAYRIKDGYRLILNGKSIQNAAADQRAKLGLFLAFQNPVELSGVNTAEVLRVAVSDNKRRCKAGFSVTDLNLKMIKTAKEIGLKQDLLGRSMNEDFSGGEKKKLEILQALVLAPKYVIFDEIDTGLDIDALKLAGKAIMSLKKQGAGILLVTHYQRILKYISCDRVHIMINGKIAGEGGREIMDEIEDNGYIKWT